MSKHFEISTRQLATILAALRYWQQDLAENGVDDIIDGEHFKEEKPLSVNQIDHLCEYLNQSN